MAVVMQTSADYLFIRSTTAKDA